MPNDRDLPEIPAIKPVTRTVAQLSDELAEALGMVFCLTCERHYVPEQMARPGSCFRQGVDVYRMWPTCKACADEKDRDAFREQGHGW